MAMHWLQQGGPDLPSLATPAQRAGLTWQPHHHDDLAAGRQQLRLQLMAVAADLQNTSRAIAAVLWCKREASNRGPG